MYIITSCPAALIRCITSRYIQHHYMTHAHITHPFMKVAAAWKTGNTRLCGHSKLQSTAHCSVQDDHAAHGRISTCLADRSQLLLMMTSELPGP